MALTPKWIQRLLRWLFSPDSRSFDRIVLSAAALRQIAAFAKTAHPDEFSALLEGRVLEKTLRITNVVYQHYEATERSAIITLDYPIGTRIVGTVHSHSGNGKRPSAADRRYFNKYGFVNFIICHPYRVQDLACYGADGQELAFRTRQP